MSHEIDRELRTLLVCPRCRGELEDIPRGLLCRHDEIVWPVRDGVPWMVEERVKPARPAELEAG